MMTPTNTSSITRTEQTKHIKDKAITMAEALKEVSEAAVTSEAITVSREVKAAADMIH
jgi:hypothetical protein